MVGIRGFDEFPVANTTCCATMVRDDTGVAAADNGVLLSSFSSFCFSSLQETVTFQEASLVVYAPRMRMTPRIAVMMMGPPGLSADPLGPFHRHLSPPSYLPYHPYPPKPTDKQTADVSHTQASCRNHTLRAYLFDLLDHSSIA